MRPLHHLRSDAKFARDPLLRVAVALVALLALSLLATYHFFRDAQEKTLAFEVAKALLQVGVVAVAGAVISLLTSEYQRHRLDAEKKKDQQRDESLRNREREVQAADKAKEATRRAIDYRESLLLSSLSSAAQAYAQTKKARRLLRARARISRMPNKVILAEFYDKYMDWLNDAQLQLENLARDIETSAPAFSLPSDLRKHIGKMDSYLSALIKEYETKRCEFQGESPSFPLSKLPHLARFLAPSTEGDFIASVVTPYREVQKALREDLLHPFLT